MIFRISSKEKLFKNYKLSKINWQLCGFFAGLKLEDLMLNKFQRIQFGKKDEANLFD